MTSNRLREIPRGTGAWLVIALSCGLACGGSSSPDDTGSAAGGDKNSATGAGGGPGTGGGIIGTGGSIQFDAGPQGDGSRADAPDGCGLSAIRASTKIVNILLVIDRSGSMTATPAGFSTDKWTAMKSALSGALAKVKGGISMGLELFPNNLVTPIPTSCTSECWDMPAGDAAVVVPVALGTTSLPTILAKLAPMPAGGTPTAHALQLASEYFTTGGGKNLA